MLKLIRNYINDTRGVFSVQFALIAIPMFMLIGGAVDYGMTVNKRSIIQEAADKAIIAAIKEKFRSGSTIQISTSGMSTSIGNAAKISAIKTFQTNIKSLVGNDLDGKLLTSSFSITQDSDTKITLKASVRIPTTFLQIIGVKYINTSVVSSSNSTDSNLELHVLVDNSLSMSMPFDSATRPPVEVVGLYGESDLPQYIKTKIAHTKVYYDCSWTSAGWTDSDGKYHAGTYHKETCHYYKYCNLIIETCKNEKEIKCFHSCHKPTFAQSNSRVKTMRRYLKEAIDIVNSSSSVAHKIKTTYYTFNKTQKNIVSNGNLAAVSTMLGTSIDTQDSTDIYGALRTARNTIRSKLNSNPNDKHLIILATDGEQTRTSNHPSEIKNMCDDIHNLSDSNIFILPIHLQYEPNVYNVPGVSHMGATPKNIRYISTYQANSSKRKTSKFGQGWPLWGNAVDPLGIPLNLQCRQQIISENDYKPNLKSMCDTISIRAMKSQSEYIIHNDGWDIGTGSLSDGHDIIKNCATNIDFYHPIRSEDDLRRAVSFISKTIPEMLVKIDE